MNVHESEKIAGILEKMGYVDCPDDCNADVIVFNTCCIRDTAERRALGNIGVTKAEKKRNPNLVLAVVGCMPQQDGVKENIKERFPYVDIVLGTRNISALENEIKKVVEGREKNQKAQRQKVSLLRRRAACGLSRYRRKHSPNAHEFSERMGKYYLRMQQLLHVLHSALRQRQRGFARYAKRARRSQKVR